MSEFDEAMAELLRAKLRLENAFSARIYGWVDHHEMDEALTGLQTAVTKVLLAHKISFSKHSWLLRADDIGKDRVTQ